MPAFHYKAVDQLGRRTMGQMDAQNDADLETRLEKMGLDLITFRPAKRASHLFNQNKISRQDLVMFCFQLEQLTSAGVPILDALNDLQISNENPYFSKIISTISSEVEGGKLLSQALADHPRIFDPVFISLITAGEKTGKLTEVFNHLFHNIRWQDELISQTKKLLTYPIFIAVVVITAISFLMLYLVPQMVSFLQNMGQALPLNTRILIAVSDFMQAYWWLLLALPIIAVLALFFILRQSEVACHQFDQLKLNLPFTGPILNKIIMARFAKYFALMYQAGIPILDALRTCESIVGNRVVASALKRAHTQINAGESMSESFKNAGLFPPMVVRMINIGENTGALDQSLLNISYFYDRDVKDALQNMLKLIEPTLTVLLGGLLGFIILSVFGPIYDSMTQLGF